MKTRKTILFTKINEAGWAGGANYIKNLQEVINDHYPEICTKTIDVEYASPGFLDKVKNKIYSMDSVLHRKMVDIAGGNSFALFSVSSFRLNIDKKIPKMFWVPDFQHKHLPEMFSKPVLKKRDTEYRMGSFLANRVILSSNDAKKDYEDSFPEFIEKARVLQFCSQIPENLYNNNPEKVLLKYNLPDKFFFLPNQFWKHKNHLTVFEALSILKKQGGNPFLVCTGNILDERNQSYFSDLLQKTSLLGIRENIAILGVIPKDELFQLIRQSVAVINPSLFEGWSTTVEEVKAIGKAIILSGLNVHHEQNPPKGYYFKANNSEELALLMGKVWVDLKVGPDIELEKETEFEVKARRKNFADTFIQILNEIDF